MTLWCVTDVTATHRIETSRNADYHVIRVLATRRYSMRGDIVSETLGKEAKSSTLTWARKIPSVTRALLFSVLIFAALSVPVRAQTETVIYAFGNKPTDGYEPAAALLLDSGGNLLGTTSGGGTSVLCPDPSGPNPCGTVFKLSNSQDNYTETVLHNFSGPPNDGDEPLAGLITDSSGNLYGTTGYGGANSCGASSCGTVFELEKNPTGYTEKILYAFTGFDGGNPLAGLIIDSSANLYGTTDGGGDYGYGTVFELVNLSGSYTETVLYSFGAATDDGAYPLGSLIMDDSGNLFGTTSLDTGAYSCGLLSCGTVFELVKSSSGYTEKVLYTFTGSDGANPQAGLVRDSSGNLYGTTSNGGAYGLGTVFELVNSSGSFTEKVLYSFGATVADGAMPIAGLLIDNSGNLYGTTMMGGSVTACGGYGCGTVFELVNSSGTYTEKLLHGFGGVDDGESPAAALIMDNAGKLYGTTEGGGSSLEIGSAFEIDPGAPAPTVTLSASSLTFKQIVGTAGPSQIVTVTNSGAANLVFGSNGTTLSGLDAAEFAISNDGCSGTSVAPKSSCSVSVAFDPSSAGSASGELLFSDNAVTSVQAVALTGTGLTPTASVAFSPSGLNFSSQTVSTVSTPQTLTLMNSGGAPLSIAGISTSGGFNQTNDCGSTLAAGANCQIEVSFAPTAGGPLSGTLTVADNASGSPQTAALTGNGADFTIGPAAGSAQSVTVSPGGVARYSIVVAPQGGFNQTVTFLCGGAPELSTCSVSPATAKLDGTNTVPVSVSVTTTAAAIAFPGGSAAPTPPTTWVFALTALLAFLNFWSLKRGRFARSVQVVFCAIFLFIAAVSSSSCGGGGGASKSPGTGAGTYTLTIGGTSGPLSNSMTLTLTVQ